MKMMVWFTFTWRALYRNRIWHGIKKGTARLTAAAGS